MGRERVVGFEDLLIQSRITNALLVMLLQQDEEEEVTQSKLALEMAATGAPASEIARILGTTVNTVQVTVSRGRKRRQADGGAGK